MNTITFNGNQYESRRYTLKELEENFNGYVVALEDANFVDMSNLENGILVDVFEANRKNEMRRKYLLEGKECTLWDLSPEPLFASYMGVSSGI